MITGFEDETHELNAYELTLVEPIVNGLKTKIGYINAITNKRMCEAMISAGYKGISPVRIRKIIHYIRENGLVKKLIATSKCYYIATTDEEVSKYVQSLNERIRSIERIKQSFLI